MQTPDLSRPAPAIDLRPLIEKVRKYAQSRGVRPRSEPSLDIMHLLAVTLFVRDDGTGTLDVDKVEPLPETLELELG